jgi:hypothetical protein
MRNRGTAIALAGLIALAACSDTTTASTLDEALTGTTLGATVVDTIAELETQIEEFSDAVTESESAQDLSSAWDTLRTELAATVASFRTEGAIAREEIESDLDAFQEELDEIQVEDEVRSAWEDLRSQLEQLMSN